MFSSLIGGSESAGAQEAPGGEDGLTCAGLGYTQRLWMFVVLGGAGCVFFFLASLVVLMPRKFAKLYTLALFFTVSAFCFLVTPSRLARSAWEPHRRLSSGLFCASTALTALASLYLRSSVLSLAGIVAQFSSTAWLAASYVPFAQRVLRGTGSAIVSSIV